MNRCTVDLWKVWRAMIACLLDGTVITGVVQAEEYFDRYGLMAGSASVDIGVQPLGVPSGVISAVMRRDRILRRQLQSIGQPLKSHPFKRGADMLPLLADRRLEVGLLGDMPTLLAAAQGSVLIVGLVKQTSTAIVAKNADQLGDLAGKKIGYVPISSAHHTLLQGLKAAGLNEAQVSLVAMGFDELTDALANGRIDAFAAWEPAPTIALQANERNHIVFRGRTADYFVIGRDFATSRPATARYLAAGLVRAIEWMRRSQANLDKASRWALDESAAFAGQATRLPVPEISRITRREILGVPSAPVVVQSSALGHPLRSEFDFLRQLGKLSEKDKWENVVSGFAYNGLAQVMSERKSFQIDEFDFEE